MRHAAAGDFSITTTLGEATAESCWQWLAKVPQYLVLTTVLFRPKVHTCDLFILPAIT